MAGRDMTRRWFLAAVAGGAAACSGPVAAHGPARATRSSGPSNAVPSNAVPSNAVPSPVGPSGTASPAAARVSLPWTSPWVPGPSEVQPAVKRRAVDLVETLAAWRPGAAGQAAARGRVAALGLDPGLVAQAAPLLSADPEAVAQVVDAQYGGILTSSASVLVVVRQWRRLASGAVEQTGTTVDVRLVAASPRWRVTALHPARPQPPAVSLPSLARTVAAERRIHLPVAARADVQSGTVSAGTLRALLGLARDHVVDVSVVRSGHPHHVFGTNRVSDHYRGHAVDIWAVDGRLVVDPRNRSLVVRFMREAAALGPWQVGGPVNLDSAGPQYFSDRTHHDHVHLGFHD